MQRRTTDLKPHPMNRKLYGEEVLPPEFVASIRENGILVPLAVKEDGTIISGHRRWQAALALKMEYVPVQVVRYADDLDEREAIIEFNRQREKTFSQKMAEAEELEAVERERAERRRLSNLKRGEEKPEVEMLPPREYGKTRNKVAAAVGLGSGRTYDKAAKVWQAAKQGNETAQKLLEKLDKGQTTISAAYKQLIVEEEKRKAIEQIEKLEPPSGLYEVIVADPPWGYEKRAEDMTHRGRCPYPTMTVDEIKALEIPAAENCVLWLWTTNAFMHDAYHVLETWGFVPKTILTWVKDKIGLGDWLRGQTEHCILAVKGKPVVTLTNQSTVIYGPLREHSRKPDEFYELVESLCRGRKLELFARQTRPGWSVYGAETGKFQE